MRQPSEEEIRALEAEMAKLSVDDVVLQTIVTLLNLGARKAGLAEDTEPDPPQVKKAIDGARALLPIVVYWRRRYAEAPSWTAADRLCMVALPGDSASSDRVVSSPYAIAKPAQISATTTP